MTSPEPGMATPEERVVLMIAIRRWLIVTFIAMVVLIVVEVAVIGQIHRNYRFGTGNRAVACANLSASIAELRNDPIVPKLAAVRDAFCP